MMAVGIGGPSWEEPRRHLWVCCVKRRSTGRNSDGRCGARIVPTSTAFFHQVRYLMPSAMYQCHDNPMETILLTIGVADERRSATAEQALRSKGLLPPEVEAPAEPVNLPLRKDESTAGNMPRGAAIPRGV